MTQPKNWIQAHSDMWVPVDDEPPFKSKNGRMLWYMTNLKTGRTAYLDIRTGVFLTHKKALELT